MNHRNGRVAERYYSLFDTGSYDNFILRSVVERLDLTTYVHDEGVTSELIGGIEMQTCEYVTPTWQLLQGQKIHQNSRFFIVDNLPNNLRVLVGEPTAKTIGIVLRARRSTLVTFRKGGTGKGS